MTFKDLLRVLASVASVLCALLSVLAVAAASAVAAGDANMASCPNESSPGFMTYLPNCRGYELVSPPFTDGNENNGFLVSGDGSQALELSKGVYAGTESAYVQARYELTRTPSGWQVSAISPPASLFPAQKFFAATPDLNKTLWAMRHSSQSIFAEDLYVREPNGSFVLVGPMVPPAAAAGPPAGEYQPFGYEPELSYAGASSDLSHVLFYSVGQGKGLLWPGDATEEGSGKNNRSLYEYVGSGNARPELVGVNNEGHLISVCSVSLGSNESGDVYNAVSANGGTVFFTAMSGCPEKPAPVVNELYARLDGVETVAVSEPSAQQCQACSTAVKAPASFAGASEDGSKVFFLTEQELIAGDTTMNLYEYDFDVQGASKVIRVSVGSPTPQVQGVARVSEEGSSVYFVAKAVLTKEPREGERGKCLDELSPSERGEEETSKEGKCRPKTGANNLYVFERDAAHAGGHIAFIATLSSETKAELERKEAPCAGLVGSEKEQCDEPFIRESEEENRRDEADWQASDERPVQTTGDGRFLVFQSAADLTAGDTSEEPQVLEYDAQTEELVRASIGQAGYASGTAHANASGSVITSQRYSISTEPAATTTGPVSSDGSTVLFSTTAALTAEAEAAAEAGAPSVYEYRSAAKISDGNVYLISDGVNTLRSNAIGLDASATDAFFATADPLVPQDGDTQYDVYDARVQGGFPAPPTPVACNGEACQGALPLPPPVGAPASASVPGGGNLPPLPAPPRAATPAPKVKALTRAQKLARAMRACMRKPKRKRAACKAQAKKQYGAKKGRS